MNEMKPIKHRFPTLLTGIVVMLTAVALLGGRSLLLRAEGTAVSPQNGRNADVNVLDVTAPGSKGTGAAQGAAATVQDDVQYVTSTISGGRYEPIFFQKGIPVKWTLNAPGASLNGCNNSIVIPKYNLKVKLKAGENMIEFTPDESGTFPFSCWMGMIRSSITVVNEDGSVAQNANDGSGGLPAGCCGG